MYPLEPISSPSPPSVAAVNLIHVCHVIFRRDICFLSNFIRPIASLTYFGSNFIVFSIDPPVGVLFNANFVVTTMLLELLIASTGMYSSFFYSLSFFKVPLF